MAWVRSRRYFIGSGTPERHEAVQQSRQRRKYPKRAIETSVTALFSLSFSFSFSFSFLFSLLLLLLLLLLLVVVSLLLLLFSLLWQALNVPNIPGADHSIYWYYSTLSTHFYNSAYCVSGIYGC